MGEDPTKWKVHGVGHSSKFKSATVRDKVVKSHMSPKLGPGAYMGHTEYQHQPAVAPFHTKSARFRPPPRGVADSDEVVNARGPGTYITHETWDSQPNLVSFCSMEERGGSKAKIKPSTPEALGPGSYVGHSTYNVSSSYGPDIAFNSKEERMKEKGRTIGETQDHVRGRGPGTYSGHSDWEVRPNIAPFNSRLSRSKSEGSKLRRPNSTLGPGCYKGHDTYEGRQGLTGFGSKTNRFANPGKQKPSADMGPGYYLGHMTY